MSLMCALFGLAMFTLGGIVATVGLSLLIIGGTDDGKPGA